MLLEGQRRGGRYIKKGNPLLKHVVLQNFSFAEINATPIVMTDNSMSTIVHTRLHDPVHLAEAVRDPVEFNQPLQDPAQHRIVILPRDFTPGWRDSRNQMGNRRRRDEDEDDDFDLVEATRNQSAPKSQPRNASAPIDLIGNIPAPIQAGAPQAPGVAPLSVVPPPAVLDADVKPFRIERVPTPQQTPHPDALEHLKPASSFDSSHVVRAAQVVADQERMGSQTTLAQLPGHLENASEDAFIPMETGQAHAPQKPSAESAAIDEYHQRLALQKSNEELLTQLKNEAQSQGFREGFQNGEQKGELQARQTATQLFGNINYLIREFEQLKHSVLENVQQNFNDLAQAMGEALLSREFSIKPDALASVIRRAIVDTVGQDAFKIKVHPETFIALAGLNDVELNKNLVRDQALKPGEFRIESNLTVVDSNSTKIIRNLLESVDTTLFTKSQAPAEEKNSDKNDSIDDSIGDKDHKKAS